MSRLNEPGDDSDGIDMNVVARLQVEIRALKAFRRQIEDPEYGLMQRVRELEDFRLQSRATHQNIVKWVSIMATCFAAAVSLAEHLLFK
jgi:hypothetical protein